MKISHLFLAVTLVLAFALTFSCSSDGGSSPKKTVKKEKISGVSQKGPFVAGSAVKLYELNENYERTERVFPGKVKGDAGMYEIAVSDYLASPYVEVEVTGRYVNEITNLSSADSITLKAIADVSDKDYVNINVFTHLEHDRVLYWVGLGVPFAAAKEQAFAEVLSSLGIEGPALKNSENMSLQADSVLLLASVLLQVNRSVSDLKTLLSNLAGIDAVKDMPQAKALYGTAKSNIISSTPISPSSSSVTSSSSGGGDNTIDNCPNAVTGDSTVACGGQTYKTILIGRQVWMAENLNYDAKTAGSRCYNDSIANCAIYGRLYDWATAMGVDAKYNNQSLRNDDKVKHRGICPDKWHIPSDEDWEMLHDFVEPLGGTLKAKGTDDFGFAALLSGIYSNGFKYIDQDSYWWTSYENATGYAWAYELDWRYQNVQFALTNSKKELYSVRCLRDSLSDTLSFELRSCPNAVTGDSTVACGGQTYRTVQIDDQVWMAENLNYAVPVSKCYDNNPANCAKYGRLYNWLTAMALHSKCKGWESTSDDCKITLPNHQGICPEGWHIPKNAEWNKLLRFVDKKDDTEGISDSVGIYLKAKDGWNWNDYTSEPGNGADMYGFKALPGGNMYNGEFYSDGNHGLWWSSMEGDRSGDAYYRIMFYNSGLVNSNSGSKSDELVSVRCVKD